MKVRAWLSCEWSELQQKELGKQTHQADTPIMLFDGHSFKGAKKAQKNGIKMITKRRKTQAGGSRI